MKKEIIGILLFFLVILTCGSLFSYSPVDPSINNHVFSSHQEIHNLFGLVGAYFSGMLIDLFGLGSFWLPLILLFCSISYLNGRPNRIILLTLSGGILLIISTGSFLSLFHHQYLFLGNNFSSGGIIGIPLTDLLRKYANTAGCVMILFCFFSMGFVLATGISLLSLALTIKTYLFNLFIYFLETMKKIVVSFKTFFIFLRDRHKQRVNKINITPLSGRIKALAMIGGKNKELNIRSNGQSEDTIQTTGITDPMVTNLEKKTSTTSLGRLTNKFEDIREEKGFALPPASLLKEKKKIATSVDIDKLKKKGKILEEKLSDFNISGEVVEILPGPVITTFEYRPAPGVKISKIVNLTDDLALALSAMSIRIIAPIPGKDVVGIEIPNEIREFVILKELISSQAFDASSSKLTLCMGKNILGSPVVAQLEQMPHLLIAGATGTGKSVGLNAMIISLLYKSTPDEVKFIMIDPKRIELSVYDGIPHLISPVVTDMKKATNALLWAVREMERRYELLAATGVRNMLQYNAFVEKEIKKKKRTGLSNKEPFVSENAPSLNHPVKNQSVKNQSVKNQPVKNRSINKNHSIEQNQSIDHRSNNHNRSIDRIDQAQERNQGKSPDSENGEILTKLPYIVVIVDEFADLMMVASRDVESALIRLAQMARAAGIHLILATQRPSVDVLTGIIKANFPTRISFQVSSRIDSRTILDTNGSERLLGNGDMLFLPPGTGRLQRIQGAYISEAEISRVTDFLKQQKPPEYVEDITEQPDKGKADIDSSEYDEKYDEAVALITRTRQASISSVQRHLRIGYNRAARIIEMMETEGIIGPQEGSKPREILVKTYDDD